MKHAFYLAALLLIGVQSGLAQSQSRNATDVPSSQNVEKTPLSLQLSPQLSDVPPPPNINIVPGVPFTSAATQSMGRPAALGTLASLGADYRIGPNDLMDVEVFGVPDLKRTIRVNSSAACADSPATTTLPTRASEI